MMMNNPFAREILLIASQYKMNPDMVAAQVQVESSNDTWAWNPEPKYRYLWDVIAKRPFRPTTDAELCSETPPADFRSLVGDSDHEWWGQQASWGLLQIMGATARAHGFRGLFLTELCDPMTGLSAGCNVMEELLVWAHGDYEQALAAYNGGRAANSVRPFKNQAYADRVLLAHKQFVTT